jgi:A/G-specific adenine glycosylase
VMSQQTQIERVAERWPRWTRRWPTVESLAAATLADVLREWQGLGYPRRARDLHAAARRIEAEGWPAPHALEELPGVGRYTADAIRCFALGQPVLPGDANVRRVLARRFPGGLADRGRSWELGGALMDLGRAHCRARPRCTDCPLRAGCMVAIGDAGWDPAARPRRQAAYAGSLRQRRGMLLRAALAGERPAVAADPQAAASLVADGLVSIERGLLLAPRPGSAGPASPASIVGGAP